MWMAVGTGIGAGIGWMHPELSSGMKMHETEKDIVSESPLFCVGR